MSIPRPTGPEACILAVVLTAMFCPTLSAGDEDPALSAYRGEMDRLVGSPGASNSVAAGLINPAAWPIQDHPALYLAWQDLVDTTGVRDFRGVLSFGHLAFAMKRLSFDIDDRESAHYDYTIGLGHGDRSSAGGVSYSWTRGGWPDVVDGKSTFTPSERITAGHICRWRPASAGLAVMWDLDRKDTFYQADVGLRPFRLGDARLSLFADAVLMKGDELGDASFGYGLEAHVVPGVSFGIRARDTDEIGLRFNIGLPGFQGSYRHHLDKDSEHLASTYALEFAPGPHVGQVLAPAKRYPVVNTKGPMAYRQYKLFDERRRFLDTLERINAYADDRSVAGVVINLSGMQINSALLWELRAQLAGLRERGKKVVVYCDEIGLSGYTLASVADEIWMDPYGYIDIRGINLGRTYYHDMLEKLGVGFDEWRYFTHKSALEAFSRTSMSDADREQFEAYVEDAYEEIVQLVTTSRDFSREDWDRLVNEKGLFLAKDALEAGLVDSIGDFHAAQKRAKDAPRRSSGDARVAQLAGVTGDPIWGPEEWGEPPRIAVLYAIGPCAMDSGIRARLLSKAIRKVREDKRVAAVVLRADSPGGSALASDLVSRELKETTKKKPVIVSQGMVAGSGGYWISMHGDSILASPVTVTGSIGVIGGHFWDDGMGEKLGLDYDHAQRGDHADMFNGPRLPFIGVQIPKRPITSEERRRIEEIFREGYGDFVEQVAEGRGLTPEQVDEVGQGRFWSGTDGLDAALIDELGGLWRSIEMAKEAAGIDSRRRVEFAEGPSLGLFNPAMFTPKFFGVTIPLAGTMTDQSEPKHLLRGGVWENLPQGERDYLEMLLRNQDKPVFMMPPMGIEETLPED